VQQSHRRPCAHDRSDDLVAGGHARQVPWKLVIDDMQVSTAHPAGIHAHEDFIISRDRGRALD
jgi:hypothetical protein